MDASNYFIRISPTHADLFNCPEYFRHEQHGLTDGYPVTAGLLDSEQQGKDPRAGCCTKRNDQHVKCTNRYYILRES